MALESNPNNVCEQLCWGTKLPKMYRVHQTLCREAYDVELIPSVIREEFYGRKIADRIKPGDEIAITCGSRGVDNIALIVKTLADLVKECGGRPFVFPAMGSHGGATAQGQTEILRSYGVTEEYLGCPIKATMDTVEIGHLKDGRPVYVDKYAYKADGIILCGRVKAHTGFRGPFESGIVKMAVIGMGKQHGAESIHSTGFATMSETMQEAGKMILERTKIICGVATIENAFDQTNHIEIIPKENIWTREPELLLEAKSKMGRFLIDGTDVLVIDQIGKNISGDGMDTNVTNRFSAPEIMGDEVKFHAQRVVVLDLTEETHGNCSGVGLADITTKRLVDKIDVDASYPNAVTCTVLKIAKIPLFMHSDRSCIQTAVRTCNKIDYANPKIIRILDTNHIEEFEISEALLDEVQNNPDMKVLDGPYDWPFDKNGNLRPV